MFITNIIVCFYFGIYFVRVLRLSVFISNTVIAIIRFTASVSFSDICSLLFANNRTSYNQLNYEL